MCIFSRIFSAKKGDQGLENAEMHVDFGFIANFPQCNDDDGEKGRAAILEAGKGFAIIMSYRS